MKKYHWGIIGLGSMASQFAETFQHNQSILYGAASRTLSKAQDFATSYHIPVAYGTYEELLTDEKIDIVYIATPHNHHIDIILEALENGKHVLCEKAITMNAQELKRAVELAKRKQLILAEAMTIFNMPLFLELKNRINSQEFGSLKMIQTSFGSYKEPDPANRFFNPDLAGGALLDIGTYALSFTRFFLSEQPDYLQSTMLPFQTKVDEQSVTILRNKQNEMATIALTFQAKMPKRGILAFEKAFITIDDYPRADKAVIQYLNGETELFEVGSTKHALNYEVEHMVQMIEGTLTNYSLRLTQDVMELMDKMRDQW